MEKAAALKLDKEHETPAGEALHISVFIITKDSSKILMLKTPDYKNELHWHLPGRLLNYGEHPDDAADKIVKEILRLNVKPKFTKIQSFEGHHWDICFVYEIESNKIGTQFTKEYKFFPKTEMPWNDIGQGHGDVLKELGF